MYFGVLKKHRKYTTDQCSHLMGSAVATEGRAEADGDALFEAASQNFSNFWQNLINQRGAPTMTYQSSSSGLNSHSILLLLFLLIINLHAVCVLSLVS